MKDMLKECDVVKLNNPFNGYPAGTVGTVVSVYENGNVVDLELYFAEKNRYVLPDASFPSYVLELTYRT